MADEETIYKVVREWPEGHRRPYYGERNTRVYRQRSGVSQFVGGNRASHRVYRAKVVWKEIEWPEN